MIPPVAGPALPPPGSPLEDARIEFLQMAEDCAWLNLRKNGAIEEEIDFLYEACLHGHRVELTAFTSGDMIAWIEGKLKQHGIRKIVPDEACLQTAYRRAVEPLALQHRMEAIRSKVRKEAQAIEIPRDLRKRVEERLRKEPELPWDEAVAMEVGRHD